MNITDLIITGCSVFLIWRGASRGFLRSILGPLCLIIATALSAYYYNTSKNLPIALLIGLFGPMALYVILSNYVKLWHHVTNPDWKPNLFSRLTGAALTLAWGWAFIVMTLVLLAIIPPFHQRIAIMQQDIHRSLSYGFIKPFITYATPLTNKTNAATQAKKDLKLMDLAQDPRFQAVLNDPAIQKAITENNFAGLMSNPKIMDLTQQIMLDPEMMKQLMALQSQLQPQKKEQP